MDSNDTRGEEGLSSGQGEPNEAALQGWGFEQVFGNLRPDFADWDRRVARPSVLGGAPSSWAATNKLNFGKDMMWEFLGCANLRWSTDRPDARVLSDLLQGLLPGVRRNLSATPYPSDDGVITPVDLAAALNTDVPGPKGGRGRAAGPNAPPIAVGADVSSLVFLHASSRAGRNSYAYSGTWNFADTAELLGWYEVVYDDGLRISVPVRYGVNILETAKARSSPKALAYYAEAVDSGEVNFYAYEWINPRFGKPVRQLLLHASGPDNPILLAALGAVHQRVPPEPKPLQPAGEPFQPR